MLHARREAGLYYYKARFYDPSLRRFLNPDPIGYADGLNMYGYVGGDPVNGTDPSGLSECDASIQGTECPPKEEPPNDEIIVWGQNFMRGFQSTGVFGGRALPPGVGVPVVDEIFVYGTRNSDDERNVDELPSICWQSAVDFGNFARNNAVASQSFSGYASLVAIGSTIDSRSPFHIALARSSGTVALAYGTWGTLLDFAGGASQSIGVGTWDPLKDTASSYVSPSLLTSKFSPKPVVDLAEGFGNAESVFSLSGSPPPPVNC
jgi:RHS repeat-associated protein